MNEEPARSKRVWCHRASLGDYSEEYDGRGLSAVSTVTPSPQGIEGRSGCATRDRELRMRQQLPQDGARAGIEGQLEMDVETVSGVIRPFPGQHEALRLRLDLVYLDIGQPLKFRPVHRQPPVAPRDTPWEGGVKQNWKA